MLCTNEEFVYLTTRNLRDIKFISSWNVLGGRESVKTFAFSSWDTKLCMYSMYLYRCIRSSCDGLGFYVEIQIMFRTVNSNTTTLYRYGIWIYQAVKQFGPLMGVTVLTRAL